MSAPDKINLVTKSELIVGEDGLDDIKFSSVSYIRADTHEALKAQYERICKRLGIALEANVDEAIVEHIALKSKFGS